MKKTPGATNSLITMYLEKRFCRQNVSPFLKLIFLICNENDVFSFKNTHDKEKSPFLFEKRHFVFRLLVAFLLSNALDKVHSKQLRRYDSANKKKIHNTLPFSHLVCRNIDQL